MSGSGGHLPPWMTDAAAQRRRLKAQNARSAAQEADQAARVGGRVQSGSGASWRAKGDVRGVEFTDECKYTDKDSYVLKASTWKKIVTAATQQGREPRMIIELTKHGIVLEVYQRG